jgi:phenol hydroxylase P5 protein
MSYELTIEPLGQTIEVEDGQTILDAALRAGIYLPHACCHGLCATCKVQVVDGEVEHGEASTFALMDFEREEQKCLACCATLQSDVTIEADIDEGIWLKIEDGKKVDFQAGQYVNLEIPALNQSRAFSLANPPHDGEVELNIRIVPGGLVTTYIHEQLKVGDKLKLSGPYGRFFVKKSTNTPMLFIAGGSGLSSPKSMILDLLKEGCELPMTLMYGARSQTELYYDQEFKDLAAKHPNFTYIASLSDEPADSGWTGPRGFVHEAAKAHFNNDFSGRKAYLCGPPPMIEAAITTLMQGRLYERDIYAEKFISAVDSTNVVRSPLFKNI